MRSKFPMHRNLEHILDRNLQYSRYIEFSNTDISYSKFRSIDTSSIGISKYPIFPIHRSLEHCYTGISGISDTSNSRILIHVYRIKFSDEKDRYFFDISQYRALIYRIVRYTVYILSKNISARVCVRCSHQNRHFHPSACRKSSVLTAYSSKRDVYGYKLCGHNYSSKRWYTRTTYVVSKHTVHTRYYGGP